MARRKGSLPQNQLRIRLDPVSNEFVRNEAKKAQFRSLNKYLQWLITKERNGVDTPMASLEETMARSITRLQDEVSTLQQSAETTNAFLHAFTKMFLVSVPEATGDEKTALRAKAQQRYQALLTQAGKELAARMAEEDDENG